MPTCRASLRSPLATHHGARSSCVRRDAPFHSNQGYRRASTAAALATPSNLKGQAERSSVRTILHKTELLLPRVLSIHASSSEPSSLKFWQTVLNGAYDRLNNAAACGAARVVVYGCDEFSGARELVTALLEEPFLPDIHKQRIRDRWKVAEGETSLTMSSGTLASNDPSVVQSASSWLQRFPIPVELQELRRPTRSASTPASVQSLFSADIPIIVCNPVTTALSQLVSDPSLPLNHANAILAVVTTPNFPPGTWNHATQLLPKTLSTVFVDPARALSAVRTLSLDASSSVAVQRYQDEFTGSRIGDLTAIVGEKLAAASQGDALRLSEATAREQVRSSLEACHHVLKKADSELGRAVCGILSLRDEVAELEARIGSEVLGAENGGVVAAAMTEAKKKVAVGVDNLTWWRCIWRVDDIGDILRGAVDGAWCRALEEQLIFHGGRLASSQKDLIKSTTALLAKHTAPSPFRSPVLENTLSQLQASPSFPVRSNSLTAPIHKRRAQLSVPINTLHTAAQRVAAGSGVSVLSGLGIAWAGWAEHIGILSGALGPGWEVQTAVGSGMFVTALGARWMMARWEKARRRWWRDWDRVGQGLERDLKGTLERVVAQQVVRVPTEACEGFNLLVGKRKEEIESLKDELFTLEQDIRRS